MKNYLIYYLFITLSIILNSCTEGFKEEYSKLVIALTEVTAITTPTTDTTPDYTFSSTGSGAITYGGSCSSSTTIATSGNNTITLSSLSVRTYADCTITVSKTIYTENSEKKLSGSLTITSFTVSSSDDSSSDDSSSDDSCSATIDSTLLAHYAFEGNLNDSSSYNRHLTEDDSNITYSAADNQSNKSGRAALFNGSNTFAYTDNITLSDNFTVAFWTKPDSPNMERWDSALSTGDSSSSGRFQIDYHNNRIRFSGSSEAQLNADLNSNQWNHIVITKSDNSTDDKTVRMYTGGSLRDNASGVTTRWDKIKIGKNRGSGHHWDGYIDEVKIYNRTFSAQEVLDLYECY
jgi:hypothetical protein